MKDEDGDEIDVKARNRQRLAHVYGPDLDLYLYHAPCHALSPTPAGRRVELVQAT